VTTERLTRNFVLLRALRWLPLGLVLPFLVITPEARGLSLGAIGAVFAVHSAVAITLEVPSGALADMVGRRRVLLAGAALTTVSLLIFAVADSVGAFMASVGLLAAGRALISGSLEAWYVDSLRSLDPSAPLSRGLSRGTAAEGIALALGALVGGGLVSLVGTSDPDGALSGYGVAALAGALAAVAYFVAIASLVHEGRGRGGRARARGREDRAWESVGGAPVAEGREGGALDSIGEARESIAQRAATVFRTARDEFAASATVRIVMVTGVALGMSFTAVELLWQPRLADLLGESDRHGIVFGGLAAASMLAVALGAGISERVNRRIGLRSGYLLGLAVAAVAIPLLGAPTTPVLFALVYLVAYFAMGLSDPMHFELLNEDVGPTARATLISAEALAAQGGALVANLGVGALAASHGPGLPWAIAGAFLTLTTLAVALPLYRTARTARA
jgi:MFS family permease